VNAFISNPWQIALFNVSKGDGIGDIVEFIFFCFRLAVHSITGTHPIDQWNKWESILAAVLAGFAWFFWFMFIRKH